MHEGGLDLMKCVLTMTCMHAMKCGCAHARPVELPYSVGVIKDFGNLAGLGML